MLEVRGLSEPTATHNHDLRRRSTTLAKSADYIEGESLHSLSVAYTSTAGLCSPLHTHYSPEHHCFHRNEHYVSSFIATSDRFVDPTGWLHADTVSSMRRGSSKAGYGQRTSKIGRTRPTTAATSMKAVVVAKP